MHGVDVLFGFVSVCVCECVCMLMFVRSIMTNQNVSWMSLNHSLCVCVDHQSHCVIVIDPHYLGGFLRKNIKYVCLLIWYWKWILSCCFCVFLLVQNLVIDCLTFFLLFILVINFTLNYLYEYLSANYWVLLHWLLFTIKCFDICCFSLFLHIAYQSN